MLRLAEVGVKTLFQFFENSHPASLNETFVVVFPDPEFVQVVDQMASYSLVQLGVSVGEFPHVLARSTGLDLPLIKIVIYERDVEN